MRLLNATTFELEEFAPKEVPDYAILSHTWAMEEVLYHDILNHTGQTKLGWSKVKSCCRRTREDGFEYVWIDTCCIDKTNSVELSMAINSMFSWYEQSAICYAYLSDVDTTAYSLQWQLEKARWFTRGWTLQEMLAPKFLVFVGQAWTEFGTRSSLRHLLEPITKIRAEHLVDFKNCMIATKMSWAASRTTTLIEDEAYCLLGLFGIHLSLIYGEGKNAFVRLQQELLRTYNDESVLAWSAYASTGRILAGSPAAFGQELIPIKYDLDRPESFLTNKGLIMSPLLYQGRKDGGALLEKFLVPLNCGQPGGSAVVALILAPMGGDTFQRIECERLTTFPTLPDLVASNWAFVGRRRICIEHKTDTKWLSLDSRSYLLSFRYPPEVRKIFIKNLSGILKPETNETQSENEMSTPVEPCTAAQDDEFMKMPFGRFVVAKMEVGSGGSPFIFGIAVRRCDNSLTLESWLTDIASDSDPVIETFKGKKAVATSRTDFIELVVPSKPNVQVRLIPRGWPMDRSKFASRIKAFTVSIVLSDSEA